MKEFIEVLNKWRSNNLKVAIARVIKTWGSSPRPVGSIMLVSDEGKMAGSVSGGCVEGAVVKKSMEIFDGTKSEKLAYGVSDEEAWSVGLSCGGSIQVFAQEMDGSPVWSRLLDFSERNESSVLVTSIEDGGCTNSLYNVECEEVVGNDLSAELLKEVRATYQQRNHRTVEMSDMSYFIQVFPRKPLLLVIGAAHITVDLVSLGNQFGFETIVIDPRGYFAQNIEFTDPPSKIIEEYPSEVLSDFPLDAYTFCAILSHDPKIDDNALEVLLPSDVAYIGALGSRKTHEKRANRLMEKGVSQESIDRIYAPIGESLNARTAQEIALSIMGQIIKVKNEHLMKKG